MQKSRQNRKIHTDKSTNRVRISRLLANNLSLKNSIFRDVCKKVRVPRWNFRTPHSSILGPEVAHDESHRKSEERRRETREICSANSDDVYSPKANNQQDRDALITAHV